MSINPVERFSAALEQSGSWWNQARPAQLPPDWNWLIWLLLAGRGSGKTRASAEWVNYEVMAGRARRVALVGRTAQDTRDVMVEGESGIIATAPDWFKPRYGSTKARVEWPNGAIGKMFSAEEPRALRGPEHDLGWVDELAAFQEPEVLWHNLVFGLRKGQIRIVVSTVGRPCIGGLRSSQE
jgi:phage terminase large subunit-like protein